MEDTVKALLLVLLLVLPAYAENYEVGPDGLIRSVIVPKQFLWVTEKYIRYSDLDTSCRGNVFADVPLATSGYGLALCRSAETMYRLGITAGCQADNPSTPANERKYCPDNQVTRAKMAIMLRALLEALRDP